MLRHDDFVIYETHAINTYVDETFSGICLTPIDIRMKARMNQIISILDSYAYFPMIWSIFVPRVIAKDSSSNIDEAVKRPHFVCEYLKVFLIARTSLLEKL